MTPNWRDREAIEDHFEDHKDEFDAITIEEYEASVLDTIDVGQRFTYTDRGSRRQHVGYYDPATGRFTGVSRSGRRIFTHFRPENGKDYVRALLDSTYPD